MECNQFAGTDHPKDFLKRVAEVKKKLTERYAGQLKAVEWTDSELSELDYALRTWICKSRDLGLLVKRRLVWSAVAYLSVIDRDNSIVRTLVDRSNIDEELVRSYEKQGKQQRSLTPKKKSELEFYENLVRDFGEKEARRVMKEIG